MSEVMTGPLFSPTMSTAAPMEASSEVVSSTPAIEHVAQPEFEKAERIDETPESHEGERTAHNIMSFYSQEGQTVRSTLQELADHGFENINAESEAAATSSDEELSGDAHPRFDAEQEEAIDGEIAVQEKAEVQEDLSQEIDHPLYKLKLKEVWAEQDPTKPIDLEKVKQEALHRFEQEMEEIGTIPANLEKIDPAAAQRITQLEQEVISQKASLEAMNAKSEEMRKKFEEAILMLALKQMELAAMLAKYNGVEDEEEKKSLAENIMDFIDAMVKAVMNALIEPDKAQNKMEKDVKDGIEGEDEKDHSHEKISPIVMQQGIAYRLNENQQAIAQAQSEYQAFRATQPTPEAAAA